jgi:hypothetical protein
MTRMGKRRIDGVQELLLLRQVARGGRGVLDDKVELAGGVVSVALRLGPHSDVAQINRFEAQLRRR